MKNQTTKTALTLLDRIVLPSVLLKENDYKTVIISKDIKSKIAITQDEIKKYEIETMPDGSIKWNAAGLKAKFDIDFTDFEKLEIKLGLEKLDRDKKLTEEHIGVYDLFVKEKTK